MKKIRILSVLLAVVLLVGILPMTALADEPALPGEELDESKPFETYTALGDSISAAYNSTAYTKNAGGPNIVNDGTVTEGSFVQIGGDALANKTNQCARCGWRTTELLCMIAAQERDSQTSGLDWDTMTNVESCHYTSVYTYWEQEELLVRMAQNTMAAIREADLFTVCFGANDIFTYALLSVMDQYIMDEEWANLDPAFAETLAELTDLANIRSIEDLYAAFGTLLAFTKDAAGLIKFYNEKLEEGLSNFCRDFPQLIAKLREHNDHNAKIAVLSLENPQKFFLKLADNYSVDLNVIGTDLVLRANAFLKQQAYTTGEFQFIDVSGASYYGLQSIDLGSLTNPQSAFDPLFSLMGAVHPDDAGQAYMADRVLAALLTKPVVKAERAALGCASLDWNNVNGAKLYRVYRADAKSNQYRLIGSTTVSAYVDLTAKADKAYSYRVVAVFGWDGVASSEGVALEAMEKTPSFIPSFKDLSVLVSGIRSKLSNPINTLFNGVASVKAALSKVVR